MSQGTKYETKANLLASIKAKIFTNKQYKVTADFIQTACNNIVESLWSRTPDEVIYVINDDNIADHAELRDTRAIITNIPDDTTLISFECETALESFVKEVSGNMIVEVSALTFVTTPINGTKVKMIGMGNLYASSSTDFGVGQFSEYYYTYRGNYQGCIAVKAFETFMYWNGVWYYNAY